MNVAPGAPCESKNQRTRDFNKGRREYGPEARREDARKTKLQTPTQVRSLDYHHTDPILPDTEGSTSPLRTLPPRESESLPRKRPG